VTKLSVVVACSDRKAEVPADVLRVRNLPASGLSMRSSVWRSHLRTASGTRALTDLYRGEGWSVVPSLLDAARAAGFNPQLLVASAGLGLRTAESTAPAYAATFAPGQADSVGTTTVESREWWRHLRAAPAALDPAAELRGNVLLILSQAYAAAMHDDLHSLGKLGDDVLLVGGAAEIPGVTRLPADRGLRSALGGTATGLTARMARRWLGGLDRPNLTSVSRMQEWQTWASSARREESWAREPLDDDQVVLFIREALSVEPGLSRTRALRRLRDSGRACEQSRFAALYSKAVSRR
jgi:hypothetical protein